MPPRKDITGQRFGKLTVVEYLQGKKWKCRCDCGNEVTVATQNLKIGKTKSCGCLRKAENKIVGLPGKAFNMLTVVEDLGMVQKPCRLLHSVLAKCVCGSIKEYLLNNLAKGNTKCCGCIKPDQRGNSLVGMRFGRLVITEELEGRESGKNKTTRIYRGTCDCGKSTSVFAINLLRGLTKSCGCLARENTSKMFLNKPLSLQHVQKLSAARKGKPSFWKGKKHSEASRKKLSLAHKGRVCPTETRLKMSEIQKKRIENGHHNFWKGGVTKENKTIRGGINYRLWRESVFLRDNWTCQKCNQKGGHLHAHHIKEFAKHIELRFETSNGTTLCSTCHAMEHTHKINSKPCMRTFRKTNSS